MGTKAYKCNIAYTLGATGKGVTLGVMDSDALLSHPELGDGGIIALKNFMDAAYEVAKKYGIIQVFTAGNRNGMKESYTRAMLPYFRPDAEKY